MTVDGLPLHPLVVHFTIVFLLLVAGAQVLAVLLPRFRAWIGWGLPLGGVVTAFLVWITAASGDDLSDTRDTPLVEKHEDWGELLRTFGITLGIATVVYWLITSPWGREKLGDRLPSWLVTVLGIAAALIAAATIVITILTGHSGATAVWS